MMETGLSETTVGRILTDARRDTTYFRDCQFVVAIRAGQKGRVVRYLCRYCGWAFTVELEANQCAWDHVFKPRPLDNPAGRLVRNIDSRVPPAR